MTARKVCPDCEGDIYWSVNYLAWFHYEHGAVIFGECPYSGGTTS